MSVGRNITVCMFGVMLYWYIASAYQIVNDSSVITMTFPRSPGHKYVYNKHKQRHQHIQTDKLKSAKQNNEFKTENKFEKHILNAKQNSAFETKGSFAKHILNAKQNNEFETESSFAKHVLNFVTRAYLDVHDETRVLRGDDARRKINRNDFKPALESITPYQSSIKSDTKLHAVNGITRSSKKMSPEDRHSAISTSSTDSYLLDKHTDNDISFGSAKRTKHEHNGRNIFEFKPIYRETEGDEDNSAALSVDAQYSKIVENNRHERSANQANQSSIDKDIKTPWKRPSDEDVYTLLLIFNNITMQSVFFNVTLETEKQCIDILEHLYGDAPDDGHMYCNSSWDEASCWPRTLAGTTASVPCPAYLMGISESNNATKYCHENGTWAEKAVYNSCVPEDEVVEEESHTTAVRIVYNVGFTVSTLALIIALSLFLYFRSLRCLRNSIHCHLIVTFILKNIVWIILRHSLMFLQDSSSSWLCKTLTTLFSFFHATNFFWMFVEGLYLHIIIVWTYSADRIKLWYLLVIGWGLPAIIIFVWVVVRAVLENDQCWLPRYDEISRYDYIFIGPILGVLFANIIFLSTIVWVLITKLRASHSLETRQYRKAVKATIILFPLLGITYVLFIIPPSNNPDVEHVFKYINAVMQSFQGLLVAVFYCFLNGEVKGVLKKKISRFNDARSLSTKYTRASVAWPRGSRDYGNTVVTNCSMIDTRPVNGTSQPAEHIPLTDSNVKE